MKGDPFEDITARVKAGRSKAEEAARKANGQDGPAEAERRPTGGAIAPIRFPDLAGKDPPPRRFIVEDAGAGRLRHLALRAARHRQVHAAQQIATAVVIGRALFGFTVEKGPVLALMCEDDDDELWRRQARINGTSAAGWRPRRPAPAGPGRAENIVASIRRPARPGGGVLRADPRQGARLRPVLIVLDPIAQLFGGNENDRFQATHFVNLVVGLAREFGCAVLLLGHPAKPEGPQFSGSTAWNASVRSRLLLQREEDEEDELLLSRVKGNYALPVTLSLRWVDGVLRPNDPRFMFEACRSAEERAGRARAAFLAALDRAGRGIALSDATRGGNYALKEIARHGLLGEFTETRDGAGDARAAQARPDRRQPAGRAAGKPARPPRARQDGRGLTVRPGPGSHPGAPPASWSVPL